MVAGERQGQERLPLCSDWAPPTASSSKICLTAKAGASLRASAKPALFPLHPKNQNQFLSDFP